MEIYTDRQTDRQTYRHTDRHADRYIDRQTDRQTDRETDLGVSNPCESLQSFPISVCIIHQKQFCITGD